MQNRVRCLCQTIRDAVKNAPPTKDQTKVDTHKNMARIKCGSLSVRCNREDFEELIKIEAKYHEIAQKLKHLRQSTVAKICQEASKIGGRFWGTWKTKSLKGPAIFTYSQTTPTGCYNVRWVSRDQLAIVETAPDEELPPLIEEIIEEEAYQKIRERFDGKCQQIPFRQDLFDLYHLYEHKSDRYNIARECCKILLQREARRVYHNENGSDNPGNRVIRLSFGAREYLFLCGTGTSLPGCLCEPTNPSVEKTYLYRPLQGETSAL